MRCYLLPIALMCVLGCDGSNGSVLVLMSTEPFSLTSEGSVNLDDKSADANKKVGTVARIDIQDKKRQKNLNDRLHFCVFENGESDYIYVGTKYGMWSKGKFDLTIEGKKIFTGEVDFLLYGGVIIQMGDVLEQQPKTNVGVYVTRVTGIFK